jgi:hypothetical protein
MTTLLTRRRMNMEFTTTGLLHHSDAGSQGGLNRSSQHLSSFWRCAMARRQQQADRALRPAMRSPGRPLPARHVERAFWRLIAQGERTEEAALEIGVSTPVAVRWFRHAGGMPPLSLAEPTGRYLSFSEREEIALLKAQGLGVREIARQLGRDPGTISQCPRPPASARCAWDSNSTRRPPTIDNVDSFADTARSLVGTSTAGYSPGHMFSIRQDSVGVVGSISPSEYPCNTAAWGSRTAWSVRTGLSTLTMARRQSPSASD